MSVRPVRAVPIALVALVAYGCAPARPTATTAELPAVVAAVDSLRMYRIDEVSSPPAFVNLSDVVRMMTRNHPPLLRDEARGGTVVLVLQVGRNGTVQSCRVLRSSGEASMDQAAVRAASRLRAHPARVGTTAVAVEVEIPFEFGVGP
jgi:TonB family protein